MSGECEVYQLRGMGQQKRRRYQKTGNGYRGKPRVEEASA